MVWTGALADAMWQPIETAPRGEYEWVLVYQPEILRVTQSGIPYSVETMIRVAWSDPDIGEGKWWTGEAWDSDELDPTHWMPLPPAPGVKP